MHRLHHCLPWIAVWLLTTRTPLASDDTFFRDEVAPVLARHCLECHSGTQPEGGLDLSSAAGLAKGGESGKALAESREESLLWQRVVAEEMPPKEPLGKQPQQILAKWLDSGAKWDGANIDRFAYSSDRRAGYDWWSLQPLSPEEPPRDADQDWVRNPVDQFVDARRRAAGLSPAPPASPRALVRRVYFDLIGLPPPVEVVERFEQSPTDAAYRQIVQSLLDSPRYGERWGRHWLDVARFGESDGFERNAPRENMWHYRDWVIAALNADMPYNEFAQRQLMGDLMPNPQQASDDRRLKTVAATGFIVAGVHNTVVGSSERMRRLARQDELEEMIGVVGQTFLGLTVNCARCHDHKFDPIPTRDYYSMIAAIDGVTHGEREVALPGIAEQLREQTAELEKLQQQLAALEADARQRVLARLTQQDPSELKDIVQPVASWDFENDLRDSIGTLHGVPKGDARLEEGALVLDGKSYVETAKLPFPVAAKTLEAWVQVDGLQQRGGGVLSVQTVSGSVFDAIVYGEREPNRWMAGSNVFARTQSFGGVAENEAGKKPVHIAIVYSDDGTIQCFRNGERYGKPYQTGKVTFQAGDSQVLFGLRHAPPGGNRYFAGRVFQANLYDCALTQVQIQASARRSGHYVSEAQLVAELSPDQQRQREQLKQQLAEVSSRVHSLQSQQKLKVYGVVPRKPDEMRVHIRGGVTQFGDVTPPNGIAAVRGASADFQLPTDASDAQRRRALAAWITDSENGLFHRTIVNRVWHYHFGTGIVETPNDLGFNGGRPSHPELLDWLASYLRDQQYSLKSLHRLIVTSSTYRQSSLPNEEALRVDADNRLLWRMAPRRMEAEVVRDAMLDIAGVLNLQMGGPGYRDVKVVPNNGTTYYEPYAPEGPEYRRRSVYRFSPRGGRMSLLDTFDCPDPSAAAPRRSVTTTPLQALSLVNSPFAFRTSQALADRVIAETGEGKRVERVWRLVLSRSPNEEERRWSTALADEHGLATLCRALYNANEFVIIE